MSAVAVKTELKHFFFDENFANAVAAGLQETIREMCHLACDFESSFVAEHWIPAGHASATVELNNADQRGLLQLHFADVAILTMMAKALGRTPTQVNEDAIDWAGAVTSVVYGRMKSLLNPLGYQFKSAIPTMNFTERLNHPEEKAKHLIIPFRVAKAKCFIQVVYYA